MNNKADRPTTPTKVALTPVADRDSIADAFLAGRSIDGLLYSNRSFGFRKHDIEGCVRESLQRRLGLQERNRRVLAFIQGRAA